MTIYSFGVAAPIKAPEKTSLVKNVALLVFFFIFIFGDYFLFESNITAGTIFWGALGALFVYFLWVTNDDEYPALYCDECGMIYNRISQFNNHKCVRK
jgi:hypothetical protein